MASELNFNFETLRDELSELSPQQVLCFACLCVERLTPILALWSGELHKQGENALQESWSLAIENRLPSSGLHSQKQRFEQVIENEALYGVQDRIRSTLIPYTDDTVIALIHLLGYVHSLSVTESASVASTTYIVADHIMVQLHKISTEEDLQDANILHEDLVQIELRQQQNTLDRLKTSFNTETINQLRSESQDMGHTLVHAIERYRDYLTHQWDALKFKYPVGRQIQGIIISVFADGIRVYIEDEVEGVADFNACMSASQPDFVAQHHKITATVMGYNEAYHELILGSPQAHKERVSLAWLQKKFRERSD